jgi:molybdopterin-guanine dinucleotide biosynthesis protein
MTPVGPLAGRPAISTLRKDGRSQRDALANNLRANAADMVKAVHHGRTMMRRADTVKARNAGAARVKQPLTIFTAF